jgi:hypothetical protein
MTVSNRPASIAGPLCQFALAALVLWLACDFAQAEDKPRPSVADAVANPRFEFLHSARLPVAATALRSWGGENFSIGPDTSPRLKIA